MPFDGLTLKKILKRLENIKGSVLKQIYQPEKNEYYFQLNELYLRISLKPEFSFVSISQKFWDALPHPSSFVMLLRSQIKNARVTNISQIDCDRVLIVDLRKLRESGEIRNFRLVIELMGKFSNIILVDLETSKIIDARKRISTKFRNIYPGFDFKFYTNDQKNPFEISPEDLTFKNRNLKRNLLKILQGFSPLLIDEALHRAKLQGNQMNPSEYQHILCKIIKQIAQEVTTDPGMYLYSNHHVVDIVGTKLQLFSNKNYEYLEDPFEALERFSNLLQEREAFKTKIGNLKKVITNRKRKIERALMALKRQLDEYKHYENYKKFGELLITGLHNLKTQDLNVNKVKLYDWETNQEVEIEFDPSKSILENAKVYFEKYKKHKEKFSGTKIRFEELKSEFDYLEQLLYYLNSAENMEDIENIEEEMVNMGLMKHRKDKIKRTKPNPKYRFYEFDGFKIFVGKNNKQNDELTFKIADKNDIWFHAKEVPGSHVILRLNGNKPNERAIEYAALLAAKYSKASQSSKVAIDYTEVKNVWKPKKAKPGFVLYRNYKTIFVNPQKLSE